MWREDKQQKWKKNESARREWSDLSEVAHMWIAEETRVFQKGGVVWAGLGQWFMDQKWMC